MSVEQRERLRRLAEERSLSMAATLDDALDSLRRDHFYRSMADAEAVLRSDPEAWAEYVAERNAWLSPDLSAG